MNFVLAGQPNSGKSTIFNAIAGYRSATANFPGSSGTYTLSRALIHGREVAVADLPGIYSLTSTDQAHNVALEYLLREDYDLIINVVDASRLGRSLELTLQLLELGRPMVVALNMLDEARRKGIDVDSEKLSRELGVPVFRTIGRRGRGLKELFRGALQAAHTGGSPEPLPLDREVEAAIVDRISALAYRQECGVVQISGEPIFDVNYVIPVRPDSFRLLEEINSALIHMREDGTLEALQEKWF